MNSLREAVEEYLAMRRSLGFKLRVAGEGLPDFVSFVEQKGATYITTSLALQWAQKPRSVRPGHHARRLSFIRAFARHRSATDPRTEIPPLGLLPYCKERPRPYIYTNEEIERLMAASLKLARAGSLQPWTYYCLFGLLAVSGLRISEALSLKVEDVDLNEGLLTVHGTKFGKSRLVPLHESTQKTLSDYQRRRDRLLNGLPARYFFPSLRTGGKLNKSVVERRFRGLSRQIGLRSPSSSQGPRLHDFRHRFAVETLLRWYRAGLEVESRLPVLSTYLGHVNVSDTYWYLTASPELMGQAAQRLEQRWEVKS